jgi:glycerol-3-phosphate dehydrogenase (NAD(P)+)
MYLSSVAIDEKHVKVSNDLIKTVSKADIIILVIPSAYLHRTISELEPKHLENKSIISAIKGIVPERMELSPIIL